ncbi:dipeptide/oligopeptide/nickel ABC transporter permease/ATP-binding protein [Salinibacterium sp. SYSU T00001]|uniref:dipeptide/oligopeptide/nickel ABC transporter permease/ATP-binding protein n=1 Tax=Homoserinimonas sedimenticola TaxID=2986805 RepID=UPI002236B869|nr:dipeptide/oligopeptide/nickel ABC transporter permease/ATP-binding protein [Salinibacterium sedimenticola]MCW4385670.1 dipeptide/oligopeptide/nickel ABC transporter permease/ATP-binding protein [Salinibacterium sedimenticola]
MSETFTSNFHSVEAAPPQRSTNLGRILARVRRQPATLISFGFIVLLAVVAVTAPWLAPLDPTASDFDSVLQPPSAEHLLGTDDLGRDQFSRLLFGTQIVLLVALGAVVVAAVLGVPLGLVFGFYGGWWDRIGMRFIDMAQALPGMLIGLTVITIFGRNIFILMIAIGLIFASAFARVTRATVLGERGKLYVEAAEVAGLRKPQIIFGQVFPNLIGPMITQAAVFLGSAIMIESAMSFLGIGLDSDTPSWGAMLSLAVEKQNVAPYLTWPPGIAIILTVLAFNVFGDGLNDALTGEKRRNAPRIRGGAPRAALSTAASRATQTADAATGATSQALVLEARDVTVALNRPSGEQVNLVSGVSVSVGKGEVVGLLGESGSGKSTFARAVLGMLPAGTWLADGTITLAGEEISHRSAKELRHIRGDRLGAVFQDPMSALSPVHTIGAQLIEPLRIHKGMSRPAARARAVELLERVGVKNAAGRLDDYPHQFSGGMAQRVAIAMALAAEPELLIADEATSALDVTTQSQVLDLILDLRDEFGMGVLMITHSLGVVAETCDRAAVMYRGRVVETAGVEKLFDNPEHPYTAALLAANPVNAVGQDRLATIDPELRAVIDASIDAQAKKEAVR